MNSKDSALKPIGTPLEDRQATQKIFEGSNSQRLPDVATGLQVGNITVIKVFPDDWKELSELAHLAAFNKSKPAAFDRIDYTLLGVNEKDEPIAYVTIRETDHESVYWHFGGAFVGTKHTLHAVRVYDAFLAWQKNNGTKRITTKIENINYPMLKLAMSRGYVIIGCGHYDGETLLYLVKEFNDGN